MTKEQTGEDQINLQHYSSVLSKQSAVLIGVRDDTRTSWFLRDIDLLESGRCRRKKSIRLHFAKAVGEEKTGSSNTQVRYGADNGSSMHGRMEWPPEPC